VYDRGAIAQGEWWRLATGHMVHSDGNHALWDITAQALIGWVMEQQGRRRWVLASLAGMMAVNAGLWWWLPELTRYCGLSGMLNTLFVIALTDGWRRHRHPIVPMVALGLTIKLATEAFNQHSLFIHTLWPSTPEAHVAGCMGAILFLGVDWLVVQTRESPYPPNNPPNMAPSKAGLLK